MRHLFMIFLGMTLSACAALDRQAPPVCDGKNRRPANPHGSVLQPTELGSKSGPSRAAPGASSPSRGAPHGGGCH